MLAPRRSAVRILLALIASFSLASCGDDDGGGGRRSIMLGDAAVTAGEPAGLAGITDLHNQARAMAYPTPDPALPPLAWSDTIAASSAQWAAGCQWRHSDNTYGENIYASAGFVPNAAQVVGSWVSEEEDYRYSSNSCSDVCGHYTQVVWRNTTEVGCAIQHCNTGSPFGGFSEWTFVVCEYDPPGNSGGRPY